MHYRCDRMGTRQIHIKRQWLHHHDCVCRRLPANSRPLCCAVELYRNLHTKRVLQGLENIPGPHGGIQVAPVHVRRYSCRPHVPDLRRTRHASDKSIAEHYDRRCAAQQTVNIRCRGIVSEVGDDSCAGYSWVGGPGCDDATIEVGHRCLLFCSPIWLSRGINKSLSQSNPIVLHAQQATLGHTPIISLPSFTFSPSSSFFCHLSLNHVRH
jgi:hypothetical protein